MSKALLEMVFVGFGVFLAMAADQWRSDRQHRNQARDALERFKVEIQTNQAAVEKVKDLHALLKFLHSVKIWLDDILYYEPALTENYRRILPLIDRALKD